MENRRKLQGRYEQRSYTLLVVESFTPLHAAAVRLAPEAVAPLKAPIDLVEASRTRPAASNRGKPSTIGNEPLVITPYPHLVWSERLRYPLYASAMQLPKALEPNPRYRADQ